MLQLPTNPTPMKRPSSPRPSNAPLRAQQQVFPRHQLQPKTHPYIQGILTTPIGRNKTFRATETDDDDNDEAASNAEAIDSATAERSNTHKVMRIKQEYIPDIQGTHHPSPIRSYQPQTDLFDESDVDDDDQDDDYSVRSDDDRKIPAPTRPKSTRKRQFDDSDVPASSPDASPAKGCVFRRKTTRDS
ncbi:hypothetical protein MHU86_6335 [Fragilaria crotonensis]|nr:hypothetical protein MHU86_6335 [Fragilaria crotonensis]